MDKSRFLNFMLLWSFFLILWWTSRGTAPTERTADQKATVAAAAAPAGPVQANPPRKLENPDFAIRVDPDGSITSAQVKKFAEELLGQTFTPDDVWSFHHDESQLKIRKGEKVTPAPLYSAGLDIGRLPLFVSDDRRKRLKVELATETPDQQKSDRAEITTTDPTGVVLPVGLAVKRKYVLHDKGYRFDLDVTLKNTTADVLDLTKTGPVYLRSGPLFCEERSMPETFVHEGGTVNTVSPSAALTETTTAATYVGVRTPYWTFLIERKDGPGTFVYQQVSFHDPAGNQRPGPVIGFKTGLMFLKAGAEQTFKFRVYGGPKLEEPLAPDYVRVFNNWDGLTGNIGYLMFRVLNIFHTVTTSWGVAILLLTLMVKVILHPLTYKQTVSMQKMQEIQPKLQALKERFKDNPEQMQAETLKLWQEHNVSPFGGCLPMFMQIPVFIALYNCIQGAIDLKGVSFWWMADLSKPDSSTLLALLFALSIYFNSKLMQQQQKTQASGTGGQDAEMQIVMNRMMPIMMYGMFVMMPVPAGVMIYLASQSILGIAETRYNIVKMGKKPGKKKGA